MKVAPPLQTIAVAVVVERRKGVTQWSDFSWRPVGVLVGEPAAAPWSKLSEDEERATFYAGVAEIEFHRTATDNYRSNLATGNPSLWIALQPTGAEPPYELLTVTADPAEGEALTETGSDLVEAVPMPATIQDAVAAFVAEHHVDHAFVKRKRDRANPEAMGRRAPLGSEKHR
ncbi:MAG TPA: DUF3305 domain-containing protein [Pseudolabrys sp.]|nr:DUF3305 domain-containing protein [Pseudolabrys sp.]HVU21839.1 DUF3305 domain-containing protein [Rhizomicrobium sp.]